MANPPAVLSTPTGLIAGERLLSHFSSSFVSHSLFTALILYGGLKKKRIALSTAMSRVNIRVTSTTNVGPLTTTYTPGVPCFTELYVAQPYDTTKVLLSGYVQSDCKPPGYASAYAKQLNPVMSPGNACPRLYAAGCTYTGESVSLNQTATAWDALSPFEIAVECCPV